MQCIDIYHGEFSTKRGIGPGGLRAPNVVVVANVTGPSLSFSLTCNAFQPVRGSQEAEFLPNKKENVEKKKKRKKCGRLKVFFFFCFSRQMFGRGRLDQPKYAILRFNSDSDKQNM